MLSFAIHIIEAIVFGLVAFVGAKVLLLEKKQVPTAAPTTSASPIDDEQIIIEDELSTPKIDDYHSRADALKKAQIFCGIQMIPVKREFTNLNDPQMHWLNEAIAFYLAGAVSHFSKQARCDVNTRRKFSGLVLSTNLGFDEQAIRRIENLLQDAEIDSDEDNMFLAGTTAAKLWSETRQVTNVLTLRTRLNDWGVFA